MHDGVPDVDALVHGQFPEILSRLSAVACSREELKGFSAGENRKHDLLSKGSADTLVFSTTKMKSKTEAEPNAFVPFWKAAQVFKA